MSTPFVDLDGAPILETELLGYGRTGIVILREMNIESLQREQTIYRRIGQCEGVVPFLGATEKTAALALMENGDLRTYLSKARPSKSLQLSWFTQMAGALARIHDGRVPVADIASRNFLLDSDLSVYFCDFTESTILPLEANMETADDVGYSIQTDIGQLGAVMYEVATGERCEFDLFKNTPERAGYGSWPPRDSLPSTKDIWVGPILERCWTEGGFWNAWALFNKLESLHLTDEVTQSS